LSLQTRLSDLITAIGTDYKQLRTWITGSNTGTLATLTTTAKADLIAAINEVNAKPSGGSTVVDASETEKGIIELATLVEVATGTDVLRAVTPAGARQERIALKDEIFGAGVPAALDTLGELAAALGDDANFAATTAAALANRVRVDTALQALTTLQQDNARTNIVSAGSVEMGNPETDLVALYTTAKA
jgi:hypothetical protein